MWNGVLILLIALRLVPWGFLCVTMTLTVDRQKRFAPPPFHCNIFDFRSIPASGSPMKKPLGMFVYPEAFRLLQSQSLNYLVSSTSAVSLPLSFELFLEVTFTVFVALLAFLSL